MFILGAGEMGPQARISWVGCAVVIITFGCRLGDMWIMTWSVDQVFFTTTASIHCSYFP